MPLRLQDDGAQLHAAVLGRDVLDATVDAVADQPADQAGARLFGVRRLQPLLQPDGAIGAIAAAAMGGEPRPVRAILFDKTPASNWALGWHQDRVIAVKERVEAPGFGPWTRKRGALHVAPPFELLSRMTTLRVHLDPVPPGNAPLRIAPGSHRQGRIAERDVARMVDECGVFECVAGAGDVWIYATPILHASGRAAEPTRRRVLQVDYAAEDLPGGLEWLGV
jgi:hypothetical protein